MEECYFSFVHLLKEWDSYLPIFDSLSLLTHWVEKGYIGNEWFKLS